MPMLIGVTSACGRTDRGTASGAGSSLEQPIINTDKINNQKEKKMQHMTYDTHGEDVYRTQRSETVDRTPTHKHLNFMNTYKLRVQKVI